MEVDFKKKGKGLGDGLPSGLVQRFFCEEREVWLTMCRLGEYVYGLDVM